MRLATIFGLLTYLEVAICLAALCAVTIRKQWSDYWSFGALLAIRAVVASSLLFLIHFCRIIGPHTAYVYYFYIYWVGYAIESVLAMIIVYSIFRLAMDPLKGLQALGMMIFRWIVAISVIVTLGTAYSPHMTGIKYLINAILQMERTQSILILCLLVFVCFAIRPMGLNYGSRIFGVSLGLGIMATCELVDTVWQVHGNKIYSSDNIVRATVGCLVLAIWAAYFVLPEQKRRLVLLPTTSPFLRWNQISQALGDSPGFVAVGGIPPDLFAPAELEVMHRASIKMTPQLPQSLRA